MTNDDLTAEQKKLRFYEFVLWLLLIAGLLINIVVAFCRQLPNFDEALRWVESAWLGSISLAGGLLVVLMVFQPAATRFRPKALIFSSALLLVGSCLHQDWSPAKSEVSLSEDATSIVVRGSLVSNIGTRAEKLLHGLRCFEVKRPDGCPSTLDISSQGGSVFLAAELLQVLKAAGIDRIVVSKECESACASILFAGFDKRGLRPGASVGFHSGRASYWFKDSENAMPYRRTTNLILSNSMHDLGLTPGCVKHLLSSDEMVRLDGPLLVGLNVNVCRASSARTGAHTITSAATSRALGACKAVPGEVQSCAW